MKNSESDLIYCKNHPTKLAKRYCSNSSCSILICNACALESHSSHLAKLQNINSLYVNCSESLTKILQLSKTTLRSKSNIMFKCMNFVFHQAKTYCKECNNYLCDKCLLTHEKGHTFLSLTHFIDDFTNTIECFMTIISYNGKEMIIEGDQIEQGTLEGKEDIDEMIYDLVSFKRSINERFMKRNGFLLKIISDLHEFFIKKHNQLYKNKAVFKQLNTIYDKIKFEKDNMKMIGFYIEYQMIIENLYGSSKEKNELLAAYKKLKEIRDVVRKYNKDTNAVIKEKVLSNIKDRIKEANEVINKGDSEMKAEICALSNMTAEGYDKLYENEFKEPESSYDTFEGARQYIFANYQYVQEEGNTPAVHQQGGASEIQTSAIQQQQQLQQQAQQQQVIKEVVVERQVIVEKPVIVEKQIVVEKPVVIERQVIVEKPMIIEKQVIVEKPVIVERQVVVERIVEKPIKVEKEGGKEKEVVEKIIEVIKTRFNDLSLKNSGSIEFIHQAKEPRIQIQTEIREIIKEIHVPPVKVETNDSMTQCDDSISNSDNSGISPTQTNQQEQKGYLKIKKEEQMMKMKQEEQLLLQQVNEDNNSNSTIQQKGLQEEVSAMEMQMQTDSNKGQLRNQENEPQKEIHYVPKQQTETETETETQSQENQQGEIIEQQNQNTIEEYDEEETPTLESIAPKLAVLNSKIAIGGTSELKIKELLSALTWDERNLIEIIGLGQNCKTAFVFNPYMNKVEEIELELKLPTFHSYLNIESYVFLSGGKNSETNTDVKDFWQMKRASEKEFAYYELVPMKTARSYHSMVHVEKTNCVFVISGSRLKSCEKYSFEEKEWSDLPSLLSSREKACVSVINDGLYVFFGFDRMISKYVTTIERLDLNSMDKWEQISVPGNQNILKKQGLSYLPHSSQDGILLVGGINSLRNESKDVLYFDPNKNTVTPFTSTLPSVASYTHGKFFKLFDNYYNITENFSITIYEGKKGKFICI